MGIISYIQSKIRKGTGQNEDYIPVEKLNANVQVYQAKTPREHIATAKNYVKQKIAERQVYKKEKQEAAHTKLVEENKQLKTQAENLRLRQQVDAKKKSLQAVNAKGLVNAFRGGTSAPGNFTGFGSTGFNVQEQPPKAKKGSNVFGGNPPW